MGEACTRVWCMVFGLVVLALSASPAHAYLDPGTGSMILQVILGGLAGVLIAGRLFWNRILQVLRLRKPEPSTARGEAARKN